jgi:hypothetical protein
MEDRGWREGEEIRIRIKIKIRIGRRKDRVYPH